MTRKLGKEWKNTSVIEFIGKASPKKLIMKLWNLELITEIDVTNLYSMKELSNSDVDYVELTKQMNKIAPKGCTFKTVYVNGYTKSGFYK